MAARHDTWSTGFDAPNRTGAFYLMLEHYVLPQPLELPATYLLQFILVDRDSGAGPHVGPRVRRTLPGIPRQLLEWGQVQQHVTQYDPGTRLGHSRDTVRVPLS